jgi:hypothetical protein
MKGYTHTTRLMKRNKIITNNDVDRSPFPGKWQYRGVVYFNGPRLGLLYEISGGEKSFTFTGFAFWN